MEQGIGYPWLELIVHDPEAHNPGMLGLGSSEEMQLGRSLRCTPTTDVLDSQYPAIHCHGTVVVPYELCWKEASCTGPGVMSEVSLDVGVTEFLTTISPPLQDSVGSAPKLCQPGGACSANRGSLSRRVLSASSQNSWDMYLFLTYLHIHHTCPHTPLLLLYFVTLSPSLPSRLAAMFESLIGSFNYHWETCNIPFLPRWLWHVDMVLLSACLWLSRGFLLILIVQEEAVYLLR